MRKVSILFALLLCSAVLLCALSGCGAAPQKAIEENGNPIIAPQVMAQILDDFVNNNTDRTVFSDNEKGAAGYIAQTVIDGCALTGQANSEHYQSVDGKIILRIMPFTVNSNKQTYLSQNIEVTFKSGAGTGKSVVIGAYYDTLYGGVEAMYAANGSHGALEGSGVAAMLGYIGYLFQSGTDYGFDVRFVFLGAGSVGFDNMTWFGAAEYLQDINDGANILAMFNLRRLGGDYLYLFCDEKPAAHNGLILDAAAQSGVNINCAPTTEMRAPVVLLDGIPYTTWGMIGAHAEFFNAGIPVANIYGGNYNTFSLADTESRDNSNIEGTDSDTLPVLKNLYPDYAEKMSAAITLIDKALSNSGFAAAAQSARKSRGGTDVLTKDWIFNLILICVIAVCAVAVIVAVKRLEKKYPYAPKAKKLKVAVFGMDYEKPEENDIFIELSKNPFSFLGNNASPFVVLNRPDPFEEEKPQETQPDEHTEEEDKKNNE